MAIEQRQEAIRTQEPSIGEVLVAFFTCPIWFIFSAVGVTCGWLCAAFAESFKDGYKSFVRTVRDRR